MQRSKRTLMPLVGVGLMLASALVVLRSAPAQAASLASLNVTPTHGVPTDKFTAVYQLSPCQSAAGQAVSFYWDGVPPTGGKQLGQAFTDASCTAMLVATPPANTTTAVNHTVWAFLPLNDGSPIPGTSVSHGYMVDTPRPAGGAGGASGSGQTVTGQGGQTATVTGGQGTTSGASGSGNGQGGGNYQASGTNKGFGPAPHIMTPLGLISQAFVGWSLLLLVILLALLLALEYSRRNEAQQSATRSPAMATGQRH